MYNSKFTKFATFQSFPIGQFDNVVITNMQFIIVAIIRPLYPRGVTNTAEIEPSVR